MSRLNRAHYLAECRTGGMKGTARTPGKLRRLVVKLNKELRTNKGFMNNQVGTCCMLYEPLIGKSITTDHNFHSCVFKNIAHWSITGMNSRYRANRNTVFLINDLVYPFVVELMCSNLTRNRTYVYSTRHVVPVCMLKKTIYCMFSSHIRSCATGSPNIQGLCPTCSPSPGPQRVNITHVVGVKVGQEYLVQHIIRDHQCRDIYH